MRSRRRQRNGNGLWRRSAYDRTPSRNPRTSTPSSYLHADRHPCRLIERFAKAGKAIFCEKPIDLNVKRVEKCLAVVEKTKATLMVGFNRRFDPHFAAVRKAIDDGAIGTVEMVTITSRDPGAPPIDTTSSARRHLPRHDHP